MRFLWLWLGGAIIVAYLVLSARKKAATPARPNTQPGAKMAFGEETTGATVPAWLSGLLNYAAKVGKSGFAAVTNAPFGNSPIVGAIPGLPSDSGPVLVPPTPSLPTYTGPDQGSGVSLLIPDDFTPKMEAGVV